MRLPPALLLLLATPFLGACGDDFEATGPGRLERPRLERVSPLAAPLAPRREARLAPPAAGSAGWQVQGEHRLDDSGATPALAMEGAGPWSVVVRRPFDPRTFNQIAVRGHFRGNVSIGLTLSATGEEPYSPPALSSINAKREQVVLFDLPFVRQIPFTYDALRLDFEAGAGEGAFELLSIDLIDLPIQLYLPDAASTGGLIDLGVESRHGVGLASGDPARCAFEVKERGDRLSFAYAVLPHLRADGRRPTLRLTLDADGGRKRERTWRMEDEADEPSRWHDEEVDLAEFAGKRVRATFAFEVSKDRQAIAALANVEVWRPGRAPRSVLFVTSDTHRADHLGSAGSHVVVDTPVLDALAARGVLFEDCWSTTNVTSPSHVSLMTGVHPRDHRVIGNLARMSERADTLAEAFRAAGFATVGVASVHHLGPRGTGLGQGFDRVIGPLDRPWSAEVAVGHMMDLVGASDGKPIFAWLHLFDAHHPYAPPAPFDGRYWPAGKDPRDPALPPLDVPEGALPKDLADVRDLEYPKSQYRAEVSYLDGELARVLGMPPMRDALVAVTADHGEILEKDGSYFNHGEIFPDTLHVPLVLAGPGVPMGVRARAPVESLDVGRTLLDLAGLGRVDFPGRNLLLALEEDPEVPRARFALAANGTTASITEGRWHLMLHLRKHKGSLARERQKHETELFDLERDPECLVDVDAEHPDVARDLATRLVAWLADARGPKLDEKLTPTTAGLEQLAGLGYATAAEEVDSDRPWYEPPAGEQDE